MLLDRRARRIEIYQVATVSDRHPDLEQMELQMSSVLAPDSEIGQTTRYDSVSLALHWITAVLVIVLWSIGQTIDFVPKGPQRTDYISLHIVFGMLLGLVLLARLVRYVTGQVKPPPPVDHGLLLYVAKATHGLLYLLLIAAVALGLKLTWVRGDLVFGLVQLTSFAPGDTALRHSIGSTHELVANAIILVAALHGAAALFHHYVLRDSTLRHMLPRFRKERHL
jgi:cytochrome b561